MPGQISSLGEPRIRKMRKISSISESPRQDKLHHRWLYAPGKMGDMRAISANMHPTLHMSTAVE